LTNDFIALLKDSSLVSALTLLELTGAYNRLATETFDYFGTGLLVAVIYLLIGLPFVRMARFLERRISPGTSGLACHKIFTKQGQTSAADPLE
jgi:polar amino acid transport system substrate-binding protein